MTALPVEPAGRLAEILACITPESNDALVGHLLGGTSAEWLATILTSEGYSISASSIRGYRRAVKIHDEGSVS